MTFLRFLILAIFCNASTQAVLEGEGGITVFGDYLYWQVSQDQMQYAGVLPGGVSAIEQAFSGNTIAASLKSRVVEPKFSYESGFRVGLGYESPCSDWDVTLAWTRLHHHFHSHVTDSAHGVIPTATPAAIVLAVLTSGGSTPSFASEAKSAWKFDFDTIDFRLGKSFCLTDCWHLHPYFGVKGAIIKQTQDIEYLGLIAGGTALTVTSQRKNNFYAVGLSAGSDTVWEFYPCFNLRAGFGAALIYGNIKATVNPGLAQAPNFIDFTVISHRKSRLRPMVEGRVALDWSTCFCDHYALTLGIGYEAQFFWNQWQPTSSLLSNIFSGNAASQGDLMLQGLTIDLALTF